MRSTFRTQASLFIILLALLGLGLLSQWERYLPFLDSPAAQTGSSKIPATETPGSHLSATLEPVAVVAAASTLDPIAAVALPTRFVTPTPEPDGRVLTLAPAGSDVGWWASGDGSRPQIGDSFLYAGYFDDQALISALRFDLSRIQPGTPVRDVVLLLTGLSASRFAAHAGGTWTVQLLVSTRFADFQQGGFQPLLNAPAAITLVPSLGVTDLSEQQVNSWSFDRSSRLWLEQQLLQGAESLLVRITGPTGGTPTLFAWDSGTGPSTQRNGPQLIVSLGPPPAVPVSLPTQERVVATLTPTPDNVLTVAAQVLTATAVATTLGVPAALPGGFVTPTPTAANLATIQAMAASQGLPLLVIHTPVPANPATAMAHANYATAVALTTGTYTPVPANAVTPILIMPTPVPENALTAVAQLSVALARAQQIGTATPLPYYVLVATPTLTPLVLVHTPYPANAATAQVQAAAATYAALTVGTPTPLPPNAVTATPVPLLLYLDRLAPTLQPTPTPPPPDQMPAGLRGLILFMSDREGSPALYALDPAAGRLAKVTQIWPYTLALAQEARSPDRNYSVVTRDNERRVPQVYVFDHQYNVQRNLSNTNGWSYDAVWSPTGDRIAFVSQEPGNDEIFVVNPDGGDLRRLTFNDWEWDKHPSWSPDGSQIVFYSNRDTGRRQLWIMDRDGNNQRRLVESPYNDWDPVWAK